MKHSQNAQKLVNQFILFTKAYRLNPTSKILSYLQEINKNYQTINGGGCLFEVSDLSYLRE